MTTQINQLTELTTTSDDDLILIRENSTGIDKKMKAQNIRAKATTKDDVGLGNVTNDAQFKLADAGTMATQNANDVAVTGGTINNTPIGGTTASTGAFTTLATSGRNTFGGTDGVVIPVGTTAQRSGSPVTGLVRYNTTEQRLELYNGFVWSPLSVDVPFLPPGSPMGGGFFGGFISTNADAVPTHALIVAPKATGQDTLRYGPLPASDPTSLIDGPANTATLVASGGRDAADFCASVTAGGFTDWYMPARYELDVLYFSLKPTDASNRDDGANNTGINPNSVPKRNTIFTAVGPPVKTSSPLFQDGGAEQFDANPYWSSSQSGVNDAWIQSFADGFSNSFGTKTTLIRVRAVRRVAI